MSCAEILAKQTRCAARGLPHHLTADGGDERSKGVATGGRGGDGGKSLSGLGCRTAGGGESAKRRAAEYRNDLTDLKIHFFTGTECRRLTKEWRQPF